MGKLERVPGKQNWIEKLPAALRKRWNDSIIYRSALHMVEDAKRPMPVSVAIPSAINWAKHICETGDVKQWRGPQQVSPKSVAECCAAVKLWDEMKATSKAETSDVRERRLVELAFAEIDRRERVIEMAHQRLDAAALELTRTRPVHRLIRRVFGNNIVDLAGPRGDVKRLLHALGFKGSLSNALSSYASRQAGGSSSATSKPTGGSGKHRGGSKPGEHRGGAKKGVPHPGARGKPHPHAGHGKGKHKSSGGGQSSGQTSGGGASSSGGGVHGALAALGYSGSTAEMLASLKRDLAKKVRKRNLSHGGRSHVDLAPSAAERRKAAAKGQAMEGGRYPIRDHADLRKAVRAVGRARPNTDEERRKVRRFIVKRAKAIGGEHLVPDHWAADGSLK